MLLSLLAMFTIIYTPFFNLYLHTGPLTIRDWVFPVAASFIYLAGFESIKWGKRKFEILSGQKKPDGQFLNDGYS